MKNIKMFSLDMLIIILSALLIGLFIGFWCPANIKIQVQTAYNNIYIKFHPESQMDTQTIIINKATKNIENLPQNDIFETPPKKENDFILFIKKLFKPKSKEVQKPVTIHDKVID